jgi:transposase-like protein
MSDLQLPREVRRRLAIIRHVEEVTGNVALTCRYYGISRQCYYIWYRRYQANGVQGLRDRSKRPLVSPRATHVEVVGKITPISSPRSVSIPTTTSAGSLAWSAMSSCSLATPVTPSAIRSRASTLPSAVIRHTSWWRSAQSIPTNNTTAPSSSRPPTLGLEGTAAT